MTLRNARCNGEDMFTELLDIYGDNHTGQANALRGQN